MTRKCNIPGCRSNCVPRKKENKVEEQCIKVFRLPRNNDELQLWITNIPFKNLKFNQNSVICVKHWPANFVTVRGRGNKVRPAEPPSVWPDVPPSCLTTPQLQDLPKGHH